MSRAFVAFVLGALVCVGQLPAQPTEKIDAKVDRSLTGFVAKVEAKDENNGTVTMRTSGPPSSYKYHVDAKTKLLTAKGERLKDGLKSSLLPGAEVVVLFVDRRPKGETPLPAGTRYAHAVRLIRPAKSSPK